MSYDEQLKGPLIIAPTSFEARVCRDVIDRTQDVIGENFGGGVGIGMIKIERGLPLLTGLGLAERMADLMDYGKSSRGLWDIFTGRGSSLGGIWDQREKSIHIFGNPVTDESIRWIISHEMGHGLHSQTGIDLHLIAPCSREAFADMIMFLSRTDISPVPYFREVLQKASGTLFGQHNTHRLNQPRDAAILYYLLKEHGGRTMWDIVNFLYNPSRPIPKLLAEELAERRREGYIRTKRDEEYDLFRFFLKNRFSIDLATLNQDARKFFDTIINDSRSGISYQTPANPLPRRRPDRHSRSRI